MNKPIRSCKVLVTGYGGFLGAAITRQLVDSGYSVRGLARGSYPAAQHLGVDAISGSVSDAACVREAVKGCDAIIHTAAQAGVWGPWQDYFAANVQGTLNLLQAAEHQGISTLVFTSSPSVTFAAENQSGIDETTPYPARWLCHYPHTKALAEQAVLQAAREGRIRACALRPHLIWGEGDPHLMPRVIERAKKGRLRRVGSGTNKIDVVHVDHAATAHVLALEKLLQGDAEVSGQAFFLTDGEPHECWKWIERILNGAGVPVPRKSISYRMAYRLGAILECMFTAVRSNTEPPMTRFVAAQLALDHYFSIEKARRLLGYSPIENSEETFHSCESWLRQLASGD